MCLVHEQPVHTQLLKSYHIVFSPLGLQLFQSGFQRLSGTLQLLDGKTLAAAGLYLGNPFRDLVDLLIEEPFLTLSADGDFLKLAVSHDDGIIVAGGDPGAELLTVMGLKVLFRGDKDVGGRIEPQKLRSPLLGQVVWHNKEGFLAQSQAFGFHRSSYHFKSFACAYFMCQQGISSIQHMGDGAFLVFPQGNGRVHAPKSDMASIILAGAGGVHFLVVLAHQSLAALRVFPNPVLESVPDDIGLSAGKGEVIGVVGHNGAGKTTFSRALCGLHKDCDGQFLWERKPIERKERLKRSYMVMQDVNYELFADSVEAECSFGIRNPDQTLVNATLEELGLTPYRERHPNTLSGGQKQRVAVAVSMICGKDLLVFDEPTSGLDFDSMTQVAGLIRRLSDMGKVIFIVTHDFEFVCRTCSRVLHFDEGEMPDDVSVTMEALPKLRELFSVSDGKER